MGYLFYVFSNGNVVENKELLPLDVLPNEGHPRLRIAFDKESNQIFIQDHSFRKMLSDGDKDAWKILNDALHGLEQMHGARFIKRDFGDPQDSDVLRSLNQYKRAWVGLQRFMADEFGSEPINISILEHARRGLPSLLLIPDGKEFGVTGPVLMVDRCLGTPTVDSNYSEINEQIYRYYLRNLEEISKAFPESWKWFEPKLKQWKSKHLLDLFFAIEDNGTTRVFRVPWGEDSDPISEEAIREKVGNKPVIIFAHDEGSKNLILMNDLPSRLGKNSKILNSLIDRLAKASDVPKSSIVLSFDPSLGRPFVSRLSKYHLVKDILNEAKWIGQDLTVIEAPIGIKGKVATVIPSPEEEDVRAPSSKRYRSIRGLSVKYPFVLVDSRCRSKGKKFRAILDCLCKNHDPLSKMSESEMVSEIRESRRIHIREKALYYLEMGLDKRSILDLIDGEDSMLRRAETRKVIDEAMEEAKNNIVLASRSKKQADMGPELGINDWWHIGSQEQLLRARHEKAPVGPQSYNLKKKRNGRHKGLEQLLQSQHNRETTVQKTMEQQLRENQI